ncbi:MAG: hypothetical protein GC148_08960 [Hyphomonas sp.]|nr:hypothetical protein [Hyphomonas sp.]
MAAGALAACATPPTTGVVITNIAVDETPAEVRALAVGAVKGFVIAEVQKKVRDGRTYYDVEGELPDGSELEFDILMTAAGPQIVETQRDLDWSAVPVAVRAAAEAAAPGLSPVRVIESTQTDGTVIFELFAPGAPSDPAIEVSWAGSVAAILTERWPH